MTKPGLPVAERLALHVVERPSGCHEWTGATDRNGYGRITVKGKTVQTHVLAWTLVNGPVPAGLNVLHHCDNPPCCRPSCLFLGTLADNSADMVTKGRSTKGRGQASKTHCPQRHRYSKANTYVAPGSNKRQCRICRQDRERARNQRRSV